MVAQLTRSKTSCKGYMIRCGSRSSESSEKTLDEKRHTRPGQLAVLRMEIENLHEGAPRIKHPRNHTSPSIQNPSYKPLT